MNPALDHFTQFADDMFALTPPDAPGAHFCGAMFTAGGQRFPAGAADLDPARAKVRCLGEIAETLAQFAGPEELAAVPAGSGLDASERGALEHLAGGTGGPWLAATRLSDGQRVAVPANLCLRTLAGSGVQVSSLGCAAGQTGPDAVRSALFELIERDAVALWWHGGTPPLQIPQAALTEAQSLLAMARQGRTGRVTRFLALQSICEVPVVGAVSHGADGKAVALGFGAAGNFGAAAVKALMELLQMEVGNRIVSMKAERQGPGNLSAADAEIWQRLLLFDASMPAFQPGGSIVVRPDLPVTQIAGKLGDAGVQVYAADLYRHGAGLPVVKLIAPFLQPLPGQIETERLTCSKKTHLKRLQHFPKVAVL